MTDNLHIPESFRTEILRRDGTATGWLSCMPNVARDLCDRWQLTVDGPPAFGNTSIVIPVIGPQGKSVLKLVSPVADVETEARVLQLFAGKSIVAVQQVSLADRSLLLERLNGHHSIRELDPVEAVTIAGRIAGDLATVIAPDDAPSIAAGAPGWLGQLQRQHEAATAMGMQVEAQQFRLAEEIIDELSRDMTTTLTHGDLSLENILATDGDAWVAIDPSFLCGPVANEAHTVVRGLLPIILKSANPSRKLQELTRVFTSAAGTDYWYAQRISYARYVASWYWEAQNGGDPANVERLRLATLATYDLIR